MERFAHKYAPSGDWRDIPYPMGSRIVTPSGQVFFTPRWRVDKDRVYDPRLGGRRRMTEDELLIQAADKAEREYRKAKRALEASKAFDRRVTSGVIRIPDEERNLNRAPHLMSTADILRAYFTREEPWPGRAAELESELERRRVYDPAGLAVKWSIV